MFRSMICSSKITWTFPSLSAGRRTILGSTAGTCTVANSSSAFFSFFFFKIAPIFKDLLRISGNGLEESTAIGVSTGYTFSLK